mmetsp:Transcript_52774/g.98838  ORF Transcript_52774/g.98838 Transcript_52774/m.98838 type:complete len:235 (+) Transcript_52774:191-895(+)
MTLVLVLILILIYAHHSQAKHPAACHQFLHPSPSLHALPVHAVHLCPLHYFAHDAAGVIAFATFANGRFRVFARAQICLCLHVACLHNVSCHLSHEGPVQGPELLSRSRWSGNHLVDDMHHLILEEVVKNSIAANDDQVTLVDRDHVNGTPSLDYLYCHSLVKPGVNSAIHPANLKRALTVSTNSLHFRVKHGLIPQTATRHVLTEHHQLAVAYADDGHHRVQLAVNASAVVQH